MTFEAVGRVLGAMVKKLADAIWERRELWHIETLTYTTAEMIARLARGHQHDAATQCYRDGLEQGARNERIRLGLSPDNADDDTPTRPVPRCVHCGK